MKILITGATGFLGKQVLSLLLNDQRIERVDVVTRTKTSHPDPKVRIISADLSDPACMNILNPDVDAVIHLSGIYDFTESYTENYNHNVLPTLNIVSQVKEWNRSRRVPIYFASTYAVGFGSTEVLGEAPLVSLPSKKIPYAYTKALAERIVTDSGLPCAVFRLGILVGSSQDGRVEKMDGPYAFLRLLSFLGSLPRVIPYIPIPAKKGGLLPIVPVDCAAKVFHEALFSAGSTCDDGPRIFGVYESQSVRIDVFCKNMVSHFLPNTRPIFIERISRRVLKLQEYVTKVPEATFRFSSEAVPLENPAFKTAFSNCLIPRFETYQGKFLNGFHSHTKGGTSC